MSSVSEEEFWARNSSLGDPAGIVVYRHDYEIQLLAAVLITWGVLAVVGNCLVIAAVGASAKLRTTTNVFVVNLAVADTLTGPIAAVQAVAVLGRSRWPLPGADWLCKLAGYLAVLTYGCSINTLALIAVNRWVGITRSRSVTARVYTARKMALMVGLAWGLPLCIASVPVLTDFGELGFERLYSSCTWDRTNPNTVHFNVLFTAVCYPVQLCVVAACYASIFGYVRRTSRRMARAEVPTVSGGGPGPGPGEAMRRRLWQRQVAVTKNLVCVFLAFLLCLTPYFLALVSSADWSYRLAPWAGAVMFLNSCVNPFIYATTHPDFKEAFARMARCQSVSADRGHPKTRHRCPFPEYRSCLPQSPQKPSKTTVADSHKHST